MNSRTASELATSPGNHSPPSAIRPIPHTTARSKVVKRSRIALACTRCRNRKSRCDGERPRCRSCAQLHLHCEYLQPAQPNDGNQRFQRRAQLLAKVHELESRLGAGQPEFPSRPLLGYSVGPGPDADDSPTASSPMPSIHAHTSAQPRISDSMDSDQEAAVDLLATLTFNQESESNIGHFGPSSNHALFRTISDAFARIVSIASSQRQNVKSREHRPSSSRLQARPTQQSARQINPKDITATAMPPESESLVLIDHFFISAGEFLPFVSHSTLVSHCNSLRNSKSQPHVGAKLALLNAVFALSSASLGEGNSDAFICRALACLTERQLRGASIELVQALLLIATYQQNHQLSITSWTYHALAVKTAFQLGLHSPLGYKEYGLQESELRKRLWYSLINQDRVLSLSLGRPCLIPRQYIRTQNTLDPRTIPRAIPVIAPNHGDSVIYHHHHTSVCEIFESVIHRLYNDNIDSDKPVRIQDLITQRLPLQWELETWRQSLDPSYRIISTLGFDRGSLSFPPGTLRFQLVLSAHYYRALMLINTPVLTWALSETVDTQKLKIDSGLMSEHIVPIVSHGFKAVRELHQIIQTMSTYDERFLDQTVAWWTCSYTMLTVNLNLFCILLLYHQHGDIISSVGISLAEVREQLNEGIRTMKYIQRTSIMARKARQCLVEFLEAFDSLVSQQHATPDSLMDHSAAEITLIPAESTFDYEPNNYTQSITQVANDFLWQYSQSNFLGDNQGIFCGEEVT
ncbi:uncharacterized protein A1O5_12962 [Cladophialophora psammophila CBS 110553]|uniref:Zn(2)-C6 fungal-type domain-containing protein n=1 Tax=Cladophialophora psammophila CBS 110553 TaxID=1182543 RepID=W9VRX8_9EURO|nr:uncharacterized protein A1O5_12962 [Cladophialophora psammophila CBS 110553]EXJ54896.1 hypothetical protein A1O5_12962 [Cladophialophora psammophila CBS 110553]